MYEDGKFQRNPDVSWRTIEGQAVLIHNRNSEVLVVNEVGTLIWEHFDEGLEGILRNIQETFEVSRAEAERDAREFLEHLVSAGALLPL
jgi:hypothetical protein